MMLDCGAGASGVGIVPLGCPAPSVQIGEP